jgi:signal transduction histidine kinase
VHQPLALAGLFWLAPDRWRLYLLVLTVLTLEWPFCIRLADDVEIYFPVMWTAGAAAYLIGPMVLPVYWLAALLGFVLIVVLDARGLVPAVGVAAESAKRYRGEPFALESVVDGDLRHFLLMSNLAVRLLVFAAVTRAGVPKFPGILVAEIGVFAWQWIVPIPGRMAPARTRARLAAALGPDLVIATWVLDVGAVSWLVLAQASGGWIAFAGASLATVASHAVLKRLNDTRSELGRRERLALIGQTAASVFHQLGRHHGAVGMYAHLLARGAREDEPPWPPAVAEHARRILGSVDDANRVIDELLAFGQDRALNLYPHAIATVVDECVEECRVRATGLGVDLRVAPAPAVELALDKHKIKQAIVNVLENAIDAAPQGTVVEVSAAVDDGHVQVAVRDHGAGVADTLRDRLFTPFATTKQDGVGLGLALAKELVDAHGGGITWEPATPGARFVIRLPRARA